MNTPWGVAQDKTKLVDGITSVSTASHGGLRVHKGKLSQMPDYMVKGHEGGWFEEDCAWAKVGVCFPDVFGKEYTQAVETLKNWHPELYERYFGVKLLKGQSYMRDKEMFKHRHRNDYIVISAFGDWHESVPSGCVTAFAGRGGRKDNGWYPNDSDWFLVPRNEYDNRNRFGFVIDEERHSRIPFKV